MEASWCGQSEACPPNAEDWRARRARAHLCRPTSDSIRSKFATRLVSKRSRADHTGASFKNRPLNLLPRCFEKVAIDLPYHAVAPSPRFAPPIGVRVAPRRDVSHNALARAQFRRSGAFGDFWLCQHAATNRLRLAARQHHVGELLVLERHLGALDVQMIARARQSLGEMTPVGWA